MAMRDLSTIPTGPGVYLLKDAKGSIIYVGKARNLRARMRAYLGRGQEPDRKVSILRKRLASFDYILTGSETEALVLESNLIKEHRPRYNVRLKDDKRYPFIKVTTNEDFPRALVTRIVREDGARYFGPYTDAKAMRRTLRLIRQMFPVRQCATFRLQPRPCLNFQIGRCLGPCRGTVSPEEYAATVRQLCLFLAGRGDEAIELLDEQMDEAVRELRFEEAARLRDRIADMTRVQERQRVLTAKNVSRDAVAVARHGQLAFASVVRVRGGKLVACENLMLSVGPETGNAEVAETFLKQFYSLSSELPDEVLLELELPDRQAIGDWLADAAGRKVDLVVPSRGEKKLLLAFASTNAADALHKEIESRRPPEAVVELGDALKLPHPPRILSAVDISNVGGSLAVGTVVTFRDGRPDKSLYRKYRIRSVKGSDDYAMIRETVARHLKRCASGDCELPDLLLIDGGKGQLSAAEEALKSSGVRGTRLAALAKREEEVFVPGRSSPLPIPEESRARKLLQRARDEVHRFSVEYHRSLRDRAARHSALDEVPGVGEARKKELLKRFGSVSAISALTAEQLTEVPGIGPRTAQRIFETLSRAREGGDRTAP